MSKESYEALIYQINTLLKQWEIFPRYDASITAGKNDYKISQTYTKKNYDTDWIGNIEECLVPLDTIVRNPRKFIVIEEDIVDISLARSISVESVKHLSQHTNLISSVTKDGMVIPSKILNTSKEESFEVYENRFIYTLLLKIRDFIDRRFDSIKSALLQSGDLSVDLASDFSVDGSKINYTMKTKANFPFDEVVKRKGGGGLTDVERITRMNGIINDFLGSTFAKEMRSCALVRPPIQRTNVILKDPNFKKALVLWQYIESNEGMSFEVENVTETAELSPSLSEKYRSLIFLNTVLLQSIANYREEGESIETALKKDKIEAEEYVTKNIDDYVPDDFPALKMEIKEIRRIYQRMPFTKTVPSAEQSKMKSAIDRVLRQAKINRAKEDSVIQQRLIAEQILEEEKAKKQALREQKAEEARQLQAKARQQLELVRLEKERQRQLEQIKNERKRLELEQKHARRALLIEQNKVLREELARKKGLEEAEKEAQIAVERANEHRKKVDDEKLNYYNERLQFLEEQKLGEDERKEVEYRIAQANAEIVLKAEEKASKIRIENRYKEQSELLKQDHEQKLEELRKQSEEYWLTQQKLFEESFITNGKEIINEKERKELENLRNNSMQKLDQLNVIERLLQDIIESDQKLKVEELLAKAKRYQSPEKVEDLILNINSQYKKQARNIKIKRFKQKLTRNINAKKIKK